MAVPIAAGKPISQMDPITSLQPGDWIPVARLGGSEPQDQRNKRIEQSVFMQIAAANNWSTIQGDPLTNNAFNALYQQIQADLDVLEAAMHQPVSIATPANGLFKDAGQQIGIQLASATQAGAISAADWTKFNGKAGYDQTLQDYLYTYLSQHLIQGANMTLTKDALNKNITFSSVGGSGTGGIGREDIGEDIIGISYDNTTGIFSLEPNHLIPTVEQLNAKLNRLEVKPTAGTYTKLTINEEGQVIAATLLEGSDIPAIPTSRVTGLDAQLLNLSVTKLGLNLPAGQVFVGNASGVATPTAITGDATLSSAGALALASIVTGGTGYKISYNNKGLVTGSQATLTEADITGTINPTKIAVGSSANGQVLTIVGGVAGWVTPAATGGENPLNDGRRIFQWFDQPAGDLVEGVMVRRDTTTGRWVRGDASSESNAARTIAVISAVGANQGSVEVTYQGYVDTSKWGVPANARLYLTSVANLGIVTTTRPTTQGAIIKEMAVTLDGNVAIFNPGDATIVPSANSTGTFTGSVNSLVRGDGTYTGTPSTTGQVLTWTGSNLAWQLPPTGTGGGFTGITVQGAVAGTSSTGTVTVVMADNAVATRNVQDTSITMPKLSATGTRDATTFLRGDGIWAVPPTGTGGGTGSITISLTGAVIGSGTNGAFTTLAANIVGNGNLVDGSVSTTKIADNSVTGPKIPAGAVSITKIAATGTPSSTTYLRGDGVWATPAGGSGAFSPINSLQFAPASTDLQLVGDAAAPGATRYYGTNAAGAKGFHLFPSGTATGNFVVLNGQNTGDTTLTGFVEAGEFIARSAVTLVGSTGAVSVRASNIAADFTALIRTKGNAEETIAFLSDIAAGGGFSFPGGTNRLLLGTGAATPTATVVNSVPTWNGTSIVWQVPAGGTGGSGTAITTTSVGTTGTAPNWSGTGPFLLNIPLASTTGVTAGLISKANFDVFAAKQNALVFDPAPANASTNVVTSGAIFAALAGKQNTISIPTSSLMGRTTAGSGPFENISIGAGLNLANGILSATGSGTGGSATFTGLTDVQITPGSGVNNYAVTYNHSLGKFVLTPPPTSGGTAKYTSLAFTNQTSVIITHNFGEVASIVVLDNTGREIELSSKTHTTNSCTITMEPARTGTVYAIGSGTGGGATGTNDYNALINKPDLTVYATNAALTSGLAGKMNAYNQTTLAYAATITVNFSTDNIHIVDLTGNTTIAVSNLAATREKILFLRAGAAQRTVTLPAGTANYGESNTITIPANKEVQIGMYSRGTTAADLVIDYKVKTL